VAVSFPVRPELLGEALVHEAAHQHFYLGAFSIQYCEHSTDSNYFSPIKQTERPFWAVLMAYHAVVNIILYHARLLEGDFDPDRVCSRRYAYWMEVASKYESSFQTAKLPLTQAGRALLAGLQARVAAARAASARAPSLTQPN
jgi:HEXXH motif-containing protein